MNHSSPLIVDIDECKLKQDDCDDRNRVCINTEGWYTCQCPDGYLDNGTHCLGMY